MDLFPININNSWNDFINNQDNLELLKEIKKEIGDNFYPLKSEVLRFLNTDLKNCRCVLMGMDPYKQNCIINDNVLPVATGRSFEIRNLNNWNDPMNKSLVNILKHIYLMYSNNKNSNNISIKKIREEINNYSFSILQPNLLFDYLENNGVLFLNSSLTVFPNKSGSHLIFWENYLNLIIKYILKNNSNVKWILLGKNAQNRVLPFIDKKNAIIADHPVRNSFVYQNSFENVSGINWKGL